MTNGVGKTLREHILLLRPLFAVIAAVWLLRLVLGAADCPMGVVRILSVTGVQPLTILLATLLIHHKGCGGYKSVTLASFLLVSWAQILMVAAILFAVVTGWPNIYSIPEFSFQEDPHQVYHMVSHLIAIFLVGLLGAATGSLTLLLLRVFVPRGEGSGE